jgi:hypothetical protein
VLVRLVEGGDDDAVHVGGGQLGHRPDGQAEELAAPLTREDSYGLEAELLEGEVGELGRFPDTAERDALHAVVTQVAHRLAQVVAGAPEEFSEWPMYS